jgi:hypothetical protein
MNEPLDADATVADDGLSAGRFWLRILWIAVQLIVAFWFAQRGNLFFYQRF